jgi:hypothetical protein
VIPTYTTYAMITREAGAAAPRATGMAGAAVVAAAGAVGLAAAVL